MKRVKKLILTLSILMVILMDSSAANAQCSICTRTANQLGEKPARGLNAGIIYLAFTPLAIVGVIGYRWWRREKVRTDN
jgi:hypothetical protein